MALRMYGEGRIPLLSASNAPANVLHPVDLAPETVSPTKNWHLGFTFGSPSSASCCLRRTPALSRTPITQSSQPPHHPNRVSLLALSVAHPPLLFQGHISAVPSGACHGVP